MNVKAEIKKLYDRAVAPVFQKKTWIAAAFFLGVNAALSLAVNVIILLSGAPIAVETMLAGFYGACLGAASWLGLWSFVNERKEKEKAVAVDAQQESSTAATTEKTTENFA